MRHRLPRRHTLRSEKKFWQFEDQEEQESVYGWLQVLIITITCSRVMWLLKATTIQIYSPSKIFICTLTVLWRVLLDCRVWCFYSYYCQIKLLELDGNIEHLASQCGSALNYQLSSHLRYKGISLVRSSVDAKCQPSKSGLTPDPTLLIPWWPNFWNGRMKTMELRQMTSSTATRFRFVTRKLFLRGTAIFTFFDYFFPLFQELGSFYSSNYQIHSLVYIKLRTSSKLLSDAFVVWLTEHVSFI